MAKRCIITASLILAIAVIAGAFGAHSLKERLSEYQLGIYETAIRYMILHGIGIMILGILKKQWPSLNVKRSYWFFLVGILFFSGSLILLACRELLGIETWSWLGPITPVGGLLFILAWLFLSWEFIRSKDF